jgi:3-hydroxyacyl-CoA dehydrogenase
MTLQVRKTAVLGASVMGAQIAAHLANANVPVILFDLAAKEGDASPDDSPCLVSKSRAA